MKKYILNTRSESGDYYTYLIKSKSFSSEDVDKFLSLHGNEVSDGEIYEYELSIVEISEKNFIEFSN